MGVSKAERLRQVDKQYCEFVKSMHMFVPGGDCSEYRDQDDYKAIGYMFSKLAYQKHVASQAEKVMSDVLDKCGSSNKKLETAMEALELLTDIVDSPESHQDDEWIEKRNKAFELYKKLTGEGEDEWKNRD
jgi:hypothetical protein